jgi:hypothetical protein
VYKQILFCYILEFDRISSIPSLRPYLSSSEKLNTKRPIWAHARLLFGSHETSPIIYEYSKQAPREMRYEQNTEVVSERGRGKDDRKQNTLTPLLSRLKNKAYRSIPYLMCAKPCIFIRYGYNTKADARPVSPQESSIMRESGSVSGSQHRS